MPVSIDEPSLEALKAKLPLLQHGAGKSYISDLQQTSDVNAAKASNLVMIVQVLH